jgi:homoserine kinase
LIRSNAELDVHNIPIPQNLWAAVVHPDIVVLTKVAREIMPRHIQLETATQQSGNLGGLICGLYQSDYALIGRSVVDLIAEPHRQRLIPEFYRAKREALAAGALGFSISGAGPSVFALCEGEATARQVAATVATVFESVPIKATQYVSRINPQGVHVLSQK